MKTRSGLLVMERTDFITKKTETKNKYHSPIMTTLITTLITSPLWVAIDTRDKLRQDHPTPVLLNLETHQPSNDDDGGGTNIGSTLCGTPNIRRILNFVV